MEYSLQDLRLMCKEHYIEYCTDAYKQKRIEWYTVPENDGMYSKSQDCPICLKQRIKELKAENQRLREALEKIVDEPIGNLEDKEIAQKALGD
jgi:hypothetical protein